MLWNNVGLFRRKIRLCNVVYVKHRRTARRAVPTGSQENISFLNTLYEQFIRLGVWELSQKPPRRWKTLPLAALYTRICKTGTIIRIRANKERKFQAGLAPRMNRPQKVDPDFFFRLFRRRRGVIRSSFSASKRREASIIGWYCTLRSRLLKRYT
jgi:hypothetical protein